MFTIKTSKKIEGEHSLVNASVKAPPVVCALQLLVTVSSLLILAVNVQKYCNKSGSQSLSAWLQLLDGAPMGRKTDHFKSSIRLFSVMSLMTKWCSAHYMVCLLTSFFSQIFVILVFNRKWFSRQSFICLLLLGLTRKQSQEWLIYHILLSWVACAISFYLLLVFMVGEKMFGQIRKKNRKTKGKSALEVEDEHNMQESVQEEQLNNNKKLKLPKELDELECGEEKVNLHENISSLSLGPGRLNNRRKHNNNDETSMGSWFRKDESFDVDNGLRLESSSGGNALIWPAKFNVNGFSIRARSGINESVCETRDDPKSFGEFSDDESFSVHTENGRISEQKRAEHYPNEHRKRVELKTFCNSGYVIRVMLICSLILNVLFVWILTKNFYGTAKSKP